MVNLEKVRSLVECLTKRAEIHADRDAFIFLSGKDQTHLTYGNLDRRARLIGGYLEELGKPGDRVVLFYPPGLEYISAFMGCLYAGMTAVPLYPPRPNQKGFRAGSVVMNCGARLALTCTPIMPAVAAQLNALPQAHIKLYATDTLSQTHVWEPPEIKDNALAFLQYTSGSTGNPKGVMISHANLMANEALINKAFHIQDHDIGLSWLPLYHDMGLIGTVLETIYRGITSVLMPSVAFVRDPISWLEAITQFKATISGGPNFAYDLCIRKITPERLTNLDLSHWRLAYNGAEPVRSHTLVNFVKTFAPAGFEAKAFYPCYGMAETTLFVTGAIHNQTPNLLKVNSQALEENRVQPHPKGQELVSCGGLHGPEKVLIVDPQTLQIKRDGGVGEVWVSGPGVASGYWNQPELTAEVFGARLSHSGEGPFLRTGDLGFKHQDNFWITGRLKDLIIIRGRNHYPQDIEATTAASHPALTAHATAAFSIDVGGEERLVVVQEVARTSLRKLNTDHAVAAIREAIAQNHELQAHAIALVKPGRVPKTSSGKIQRSACKLAYLNQSLELLTASILDGPSQDEQAPDAAGILSSPNPCPQLEAWLVYQAKMLTGSQWAHRDSTLTALGMDSLTAMELQHQLEMQVGLDLPATELLEGKTIAQLAKIALEGQRTQPLITHAPTQFPLSHNQRALWFLHQLAPESTAYNLYFALKLNGKMAVLRGCFQALTARHSALRTTYHLVDDEPVQRIHDEAEVFIEEQDITGWDDGRIQSWLQAGAQCAFNLQEAPPFRVYLGYNNTPELLLLVSIHHITADFQSLLILMEELLTLYNSEDEVSLPVIPTYADHVREEARILAEKPELREFWAEQLAAPLPILSLPMDAPRPPVQEWRGDWFSFSINQQTTQLARNLARECNTTLYTVLLAGFQTWLHRYSGQDHVLVGSPVAGRRARFQGVAGYFVNPVVMSAHFSNKQLTFKSFLARSRRNVLDVLAHAEYPFQLMSELVPGDRNPAVPPLFQAAFVLLKADRFPNAAAFALRPENATVQVGNLQLSSVHLPQETAQFDITLYMAETPEGLLCALEYNKALFTEETAARMAHHFQNLLQSALHAPNAPLNSLSLMSAEERRFMVDHWGPAIETNGDASLVHDLFQDQAQNTPQRPALRSGENRLTYAELNRAANRLAHYLQSHGVGPETRVALIDERSTQTMVSLLAILKAGGAYVPLDPQWPEARKEEVISDARPGLVLAQQNPELSITWVNTHSQNFAQYPETNPTTRVYQDHPAYVIYTSGSLGKPKGVVIAHRSLVNLVRALSKAVKTLQGPSPQRVALNGPLTFDTSVKQWLQLLNGHLLDIVPTHLKIDPESMCGYLKAHEIGVMDCTPSQLGMLIETGSARSTSLHTVLVGGEAIDPATWDELAAMGNIRFYNVYGPTECTVDATIQPITAGQPLLGTPLDGVQIYIMDSTGRLTPPGVAGELCIGGKGLARGYENLMGTTAAAFVPHPFSGTGQRLYRTGDRVRLIHSKQLRFLGRMDHQVKLRGFRIELGELENLLTQHPQVRDAAVILRQTPAGESEMAAFVAATLQKAPAIEGRARYVLPNNLAVDHLNRSETDFLYSEMFEVRAYLKHGIDIRRGDCIFDVGTNIGLFSLYAHLAAEDVRIYGFEPNPEVHAIVCNNTRLYGANATIFNFGLSQETQTAAFTFYSGISYLSGLYANTGEEKEVVKSFLRNKQQQGGLEGAFLEDEAYLDRKFQAQTLDVNLRPLSDVIDEQGVERIDLLKINVEKAEWDVLQGVREEHWPRIHRIAVEVHDMDNRLEKVVALFEAQGYQVTADQDWSLHGETTSNYYVYAIRHGVDHRGEPGSAPSPPQPFLTTQNLRDYLSERVPEYMVPPLITVLEKLPLTAHGKVDRAALADLVPKQEIIIQEPMSEVQERIAEIWRSVLGIERVDLHANFFELGGHSLLLARVHGRLKEAFGAKLKLTDLLQHPTIHGLSQLLTDQVQPAMVPVHSREINHQPVAIIGMACRFPGANSPQQFWDNLIEGKESISFFSQETALRHGASQKEVNHPDHVLAGGVVHPIEDFDADFFQFSPMDAASLDPQHRLFLECAWEALESAGCDLSRTHTSIGVYAGAGMSTYLLRHILPNQAYREALGDYRLAIANDKDFLATRTSYKLNLTGPSMSVQTACSTSLVAVHLAVGALRSGQCAMALAGGVSVRLPQQTGYRYEPGMIFSPDGHCRAFDADAKGTVPGNGAGVVLLKPLDQAISDGNLIHAVIRGTAVNNDGGYRAGFTAPNGHNQAEVIALAQRDAGLQSDDISYVEAHGTGTSLGDPIEVSALDTVFQGLPAGSVSLGSVKTNIGHLDTAAGIAGLIKTVMALSYQTLPPTLHFKKPNPEFSWENSPFKVVTQAQKWQSHEPRRAGVSSFGIGGTNAHLVLEQAPETVGQPVTLPVRYILPLSAKTPEALQAMAGNLAHHLQTHAPEMNDVASTLQWGRQAFEHRAFVVCHHFQDAISGLTDPNRFTPQQANSKPLAFLFPGQGVQEQGMAAELYREEPVFRGTIDQCSQFLKPLLNWDLAAALAHDLETDWCQTHRAQPALFAICYALCDWWQSKGLEPQVMAGHSIGEYVAACRAGVFSLQDALNLVAARGLLMKDLTGGSMLAISAEMASIVPHMSPDLDIAAINGPSNTVVSGPTSAIENLAARLKDQGVAARLLQTSGAFHSALMDPILEAFQEKARSITYAAPKIRYLSCLTGTWMNQAPTAQYWTRHLRETVRFDSMLNQLFQEDITLLEVGPGRTLSGLARRHPQRGETRILASLARAGATGPQALYHALGQMWAWGQNVKWAPAQRPFAQLPTYPFQRKRHWIDAPEAMVHTKTSTQLPDTQETPSRGMAWEIGEMLKGLLGLSEIGSNQHFFDLGGDSLLATRAMSRIREKWQVDLTVADIMEAGTPEALATFISTRKQSRLQPLGQAPKQAHPPLSHPQHRLWFLDQLEGPSSAYNMFHSLRLLGDLNTDILCRSMAAMAERHEILRTVFPTAHGEPYQHILPEPDFTPTIIHLENLPPQDAEKRGKELAQTEVLIPFNLEDGPLIRATLIRLAPQKHLLLVTMHHIISDGWSAGIIARELAAFYNHFRHGSPAPPPLAYQYNDYTWWREKWLEGGALDTQVAWWRQTLTGAPTLLQLPTDQPRPAKQSFPGAAQSLFLDLLLTRQLERLARDHNATLFMVLEAAFALLLSRYSGQHDICIGAPCANRKLQEVENLIGLFVNTIVLRNNLQGNPDFGTLLDRVKQAALEAYQYQDTPFEKVVDALRPERDQSHSPLFQVMFILQPAPDEMPRIEGLTLEPGEPVHATAKFDMMLELTEGNEGLSGVWEYNTDLFNASTIARMIRHYKNLLAAVVEEPNTPISQIPLWDQEERALLVRSWRGEAVEETPDVLTLIQKQVETQPQAIALQDAQGKTLTYGELWRESKRLAHQLLTAGVDRERMVGICLDRNREMILSMLAVLHTGGAWLPLDPTYPMERLKWMLQDANAHVLISQNPGISGSWFHLNPNSSGHETMEAQQEIHPQQAAYTIYTSGSTGTPKGVTLTRKGLSNLVNWQLKELPKPARTLQFTSLCFDVSVQEIFSTLCGGVLVLVDDALRRDGTALRSYLEQQRIARLFLPFAALDQLAEVMGETRLPDLTEIITAGEQLKQTPALTRLLKNNPTCRLFNQYGPTEAHVIVSCMEVTTGDPLPPIGKPISNAELYVLDDHGRPNPFGVPGHLHIGGHSPARSYVGKPGLTALAFRPNPFGSSGSRLYQTGDLALFREDGNLMFLGRSDRQTKVRGFRVEPGEIEVQLRQHPAITQAAVKVWGDRLLAYLIRTDSEPPDLKSWLSQRLPHYMIPSNFIFLDSFPQTPGGKVDYKALPQPEVHQSETTPPRTPVEKELAAIWTELLGIPNIGIHCDFFELGGHSLLATRLIHRVRDIFFTNLSLARLFEAPTIEALAEMIEAARGEDPGTHALPQLQHSPQDLHQPFPLTHIQEAYWVGRDQAFELGGVASHGYLEIDSHDLDLNRFSHALRLLIERHQMLRTRILSNGTQQVMITVPHYEIPVEDLSDWNESHLENRLLAIREELSHEVMAADSWPLFRVSASRCPQDRIRLHLSIDALLVDASSLLILFGEWAQLYEQPQTPLPPINISFRDYVLTEQAMTQTGQYQRSKSYWFSRLENLPPAPELPMAKNPMALSHHRFHRRSGSLDLENWNAIKSRAARAGITASGFLLAAFSEVLAAWSKNPQFTINLTLFNRHPFHPDVNRLVGDFTSLTLLEIDHESHEHFTARARQIQQRLWQDLDHRYISGVQVMRELARVRGGGPRGAMPVVFTSALALSSTGQDTSVYNRFGDMVYGISQTPQVWLDHQVTEENGALVFVWDSLEELFPSGMLDAMWEAYNALLQDLAREETAWEEKTRLIRLSTEHLAARREANQTQQAVNPRLIHANFLERVLQCPHNTALIQGQTRLTYRQTARRAAAISNWLKGVKPNQLVAVVMEKGWEQAVAVLGIVTAGAAYLPIDAGLPEERINWLLETGDVTHILTQSKVQERQTWPQQYSVLSVDLTEEAEWSSNPGPASPEDLAYVIFTSGSTGQPKGVMLDHQAAVNTILDMDQRYEVNETDRVLAISALNFDLSVYDIFGVLGRGGALVFPEPWGLKDPEHWQELMVTHGVTLWNTVPALMRMLVEHLSGHGIQNVCPLRTVLLSGDWIPTTLPGRINEIWRNARVVSLGGATEAAIWSIYHNIDGVDPSWESIPYGKPLINQQFHILDPHLNHCPTWVPGHLYIAGTGLARGYWRNEEKTNAAFFQHPQTGERLYRTGDLGRYHEDGTIEFLGRDDFQVKVSGYRIELGEIESALEQFPGVSAAAAGAFGPDRHNRQLAAWVVFHPWFQDNQTFALTTEMQGSPEKDPQHNGIVLTRSETGNSKLSRSGSGTYATEPLDFQTLSSLLETLSVTEAGSGYAYASAGGRYLVQTRLYIRYGRVAGLDEGVYAYHPQTHQLVPCQPLEEGTEMGAGAFSIYFVVDTRQVTPGQREMAREALLLEAGAMAQLLFMSGAETGLQLHSIPSHGNSALTLWPNHSTLFAITGGVTGYDGQTEPERPSQLAILQDHLRKKLPDYMVPATFQVLDALPLTSNGKIDRKALPEPQATASHAIPYVAAQTQTEEQLTQLVLEILDIQQAGIHHNFFDLGGDSVAATRLIARFPETFGVKLSLRHLFEKPTIAAMAEHIDNLKWVVEDVDEEEGDDDFEGEL